MKTNLGGIILTAAFLPATFFAQAKESPSLVINEISWMGNFESYSNEWIELYNPNDFEINLDNWILKTERESINIILEGKVKPKEFYFLERTNDNTVKNIKADLIYKGSLNNKGEG